MNEEQLEQAQILYCEKYGVIESELKGKKMTYYTSHLLSRVTYKVVVNLENGEENRTELKNYLKKGEVNSYL